MNISIKWQHEGFFRRFSVDVPEKASAYEALLSKVKEVVPGFKAQLGWKDVDGDLIVMGSDAEVREAIRESSDMLLRVFTVETESDSSKDEPKPTVNEQAKPKCGGGKWGNFTQEERMERTKARYVQQLLVNKEIKKLGEQRLKQTAQLEEANLDHHNHQLLLNKEIEKIGLERVKAAIEEVQQHGAAMETDGNDAEETPVKVPLDGKQVHNGVTCDSCNKGVTGIRYKCLNCADYDLCADCEHTNQHGHDASHIMIRITDPSDRSWMPMFWRHRHRHTRQNGGHPGHGGPWAWAGRGGAWGGRGHCTGARKRQGDPYANAMQYLTTVGKSVAEALGPFGIDVDIDVEHDGVREKVPASATSTAGSQPSTPKEPPKDGVPKEKTPEPMDNSIASPSEGQQDWTVLDTPVPENANAQTLQPTTVPSAPAAPGGIYPTVPQAAATDVDTTYNQVIESLLAMGFNDDGGWLKSLVAAKKGDINEVLNALNPRQ